MAYAAVTLTSVILGRFGKVVPSVLAHGGTRPRQMVHETRPP